MTLHARFEEICGARLNKRIYICPLHTAALKKRSTMTAPKTTSTTPEQMRAARAQGNSASDFARIRREAAAGVDPAVDRDSPDASALIRKEIVKRRAGRARWQR